MLESVIISIDGSSGRIIPLLTMLILKSFQMVSYV
jgi:hypothetical protein